MLILDKIRNFKKSLSSRHPLIEIFIYGNYLLHNLNEYKRAYPELMFAPVLKANAYGHGLEQVLSVLKAETVPFVVVDSYFEARIARLKAPNLQVLVIGYSRFESIENSDFKKTTFALVSFDQLEELSAKLKKPKRFHLKLDTGMHRQGILENQYADALKLFKTNPNILLEGLCSHLADPENEAESLKQIANWNRAVKFFKKKFTGIRYTHLSATGGLKFKGKLEGNLVRLGIGFYGLDENHPAGLNLGPALEMRSIITGIKEIRAGEKIGYGFTFIAPQKMRIASVPVGFFEGVDRRLSNIGYFKIGQKFCPILGRVSMNISTIDVSGVPEINYGDEAVIISAKADDKNSVENIAKNCSTSAYDILVHIPQHLRRILV